MHARAILNPVEYKFTNIENNGEEKQQKIRAYRQS